ncbi:hypothetical protein [uncultured Ferrimonas sp.]|uniref:hypothetical protein n=1 Tax=uncultured Ferrimonas sp. TaxID=432640 RepID=UPI002626E469|nr:hypothetical protein [uncultured Ferrimonas sp.]
MDDPSNQNYRQCHYHGSPPIANTSPAAIADLNRLLREQLQVQPSSTLSSTAATTTIESAPTPSPNQAAVAAVTAILAAETAAASVALGNLYQGLLGIYQRIELEPSLRTRQYVSRHGLVLSPDQCVTTQTDTHRISRFIRGIDQALIQLQQQPRERPLNVVYPACGPFAPLLLPLLCFYQNRSGADPINIKVTLIDIQPGAVASLQAVTHELGLGKYIESIVCMDGCDYRSEQPIDLLIIEAMQHGFSREAHLPLAQGLVPQMSDHGVLIPERIELSAQLVVGQHEYIERWQKSKGNEQPLPAERIKLGTVLTLTKESVTQLCVRQLRDNSTLIDCNTVLIPEIPPQLGEQLLVICTQIYTFKMECLDEYQSGITHPLPDTQVCINFIPSDPKPGDLLLRNGDCIKFYYRLNGLPGFLATQGGR